MVIVLFPRTEQSFWTCSNPSDRSVSPSDWSVGRALSDRCEPGNGQSADRPVRSESAKIGHNLARWLRFLMEHRNFDPRPESAPFTLDEWLSSGGHPQYQIWLRPNRWRLFGGRGKDILDYFSTLYHLWLASRSGALAERNGSIFTVCFYLCCSKRLSRPRKSLLLVEILQQYIWNQTFRDHQKLH